VSTRRRTVGILAVAGMLALGGCTGGAKKPEPLASASADPPTTASPTTTRIPSAPSVAKPERPADMDRTDEVGAGAATDYFVALYPYVLSTGDSTDWALMSSSACNFCAGIASDAGEVSMHKVNYQGGAIRLSNIKVLAKDEAVGGYPIEAEFIQDPETRSDSVGSILSETTGDSGSVRIEVINSGAKWQVLAVILASG